MTTLPRTRLFWDAVSWLVALLSDTAVGGLRKSPWQGDALYPGDCPSPALRNLTATILWGQDLPASILGSRNLGNPSFRTGPLWEYNVLFKTHLQHNPSRTGSWVLILFLSHRTYHGTNDSSVTPFYYVFLEGKDRDIPGLASLVLVHRRPMVTFHEQE